MAVFVESYPLVPSRALRADQHKLAPEMIEKEVEAGRTSHLFQLAAYAVYRRT